MARIHVVQKARKDQGVCDRCGVKLSAGESYKWVGLRPSGPGSHLKKKRCTSCPTWRQSELVFSKRAGIYAAMESWEDFLDNGFDTPDEVQSALEEVANQVREVAGEYEESADNMEDGFGHATYKSDELREIAETLEGWADEIEYAIDSLPDAPDEDDPTTWGSYEPDDDADDDERDEAFDQAMDEWRDEVRQLSEPTECPI